MLSFYPSRESRPLKKCKLGPPDVYVQDWKQREDELTETNLKGGFRYTVSSLDVKEERSSAQLEVSSINSGDLQFSLQGMIVSKNKQELYSESLTKKRPATSKEYFQYIKPSVNEIKVASFFQDLSGAASLSSIIQKKVLVTMLKEDVFEYLWRYMVPLDRASWFIKMNHAHHFTAEKRGRKTTDPSSEWTTTLLDFVSSKFKGQQSQLSGENKGSPQPQSINAAPPAPATHGEQLQYLVQLCFKLYQDGLLDRHAFLRNLIDSLDKKKSNESLLAFLPLLMLFVEELLCSQFLSRSLAELCIRKLKQLHDSDSLYCEEEHRSRAGEGEGRREISPPSYSLTLKLSAILHCVVLECPLALIWLPNETRCIFPLDKLPVDITSLPILPQPDSNLSPSQIYTQLSQRVQELRERRRTAERKWSSVGIQASSRGAAVRELVDILDNLNSFKFTDVTSKTRLLELYRRVFHSPDTLQSLSLRDDTIIQLLCQWAVAADQVGRHRPLLVSGLIWARQREKAGQSVESLLNEFGEFEEDLMDTGSVSNPELANRDLFPFQQALIRFLDRNDSTPGNKHNSKNGAFLLLCILFSELIQREVFSFEQYLKFLVARGDFEGISLKHAHIACLPKFNIKTPDSYKLPPPRPPLDPLLDSTLLREEDTQSSQSSQPEPAGETAPPLLKEPVSHITRSNSPKPKSQRIGALFEEEQRLPKTYHYVVHFPAPDCSDRVEAQRASLLYGVGAMREYCLRVLAANKEMVVEVAGAKFEQYPSKQVLKDFSTLPICVQQEVASSCAANYKRNKLLSLPKLIFIVELLDLSGSVNRLIEFLFDVIVSMQEEDSMKDSHPNIESPPTRPKELQLSFRIPVVSILHAYLPSLLASAYHTSHIFERLTFVFEKVKSSDHALRSDQMRVFLFLNQLYQSCFYLQEAHKDTFGPFQKSLEHTTHCNYQLNCTDLSWDQVFRHKLELEQHTDISSTVGSLCSSMHKEVVDSFSLICEFYAKACNASSVDIIRDLAHILADVCSECPSLNNVFMEAIRAICAPSPKHGFKELHKYILPEKPLNHNKLIIFIAFVVFHNPLLLPNLVDSVMTAACQYHRNPDSSDHQTSALDITCLLILSILTEEGRVHLDTTKQNPGGLEDWHPIRKLPLYVKRFLYVQNQQLPLSSISELLKQMVQLQESYGGEKKTSSLSSYKKINRCLEAVVSQSWVQEKCQCEVEQLALALTEKEKDSGTVPGMGGESKLKTSHVKLLANYICYHGSKQANNIREDKAQVLKILESLDLWSLRSSLIQLFVLLQLTSQQQQLMKITDTISQCAFDVFSQKQQQHCKPDSGEIDIYSISPAWLVAPLVSRLPSNVHGRILKLAGDQSKGEWWTLGAGAQSCDSKEGVGSSGKQQPFLELVLACLHSGSQEELLDPLSKQVTSFLKAPAEEKQPSDPKVRSHLNASLKVRLGLVGSLLNIALQNACYEWCDLLTKLICSGAVDPDHTGTLELYTTTLDMLCILYRSLGSEGNVNSASREPRKCLNDLVKHELAHGPIISSKCIKELSQLVGIPIPALHIKLFKSYSDHGFNPDDLVEYSLPAWDVLEGFPHNNILSLSHYLKFLRHEPRPLKYEEQYRLCFLHTHGDKNYTPYHVALPKAPDIVLPSVQSAVPPLSAEQILSTPTESPTSKKQKRISISSVKDKRQEQLTPIDIKPQIMNTNSFESSMQHARTAYSQPLNPYMANRNIGPGQASIPSYQNYQYHHHHQQQQQQQDRLAIRGYNTEEMLSLDQLASYGPVNTVQQQYPMANQRIYSRPHVQNMSTYDNSRVQMPQKLINIDSYGMPSGVNSSMNQLVHSQNMRYAAQSNPSMRQRSYPTKHIMRPVQNRMSMPSNMMGQGTHHMNQYQANPMQYQQFDQANYQSIPQRQYATVPGTRQAMPMPRVAGQMLPQQNNQGVNYVQD